MPKQKSKKKQKRQKPFQKRRQYDQSDVENAVQAVSLQKISVREAANLFNVPKSTISDKIKGKTQIDVKLGHPPLISKEVEDELCARLINYTQRGFPLVPEDVRRLAYLYCGKMGVDHPFNKTIGLAGRVWFKNFTQRHPVLSERTPENLSRARARAADPVATEAWFNEIKQILTEKGVIDKPHLMYNADESGFTYVPDPPKTVVGVKGAKNTPLISSGEKGANTTLIAGMSATGHFTPPFIIHNGSQRLLETHKLHFPPGTCHTQTKVGYVNSLVWVTFLEHLGKYRVQPGPGETTVLFIDGHGSHVYPPEAHLKAIELNIVTICLPPHMTSYIQPLDVGFFGPMKHYYQKELVKWMRLHRGDIVTRNEFGAIFSESWAAAIKEQTAINAFRRSGLYPFDFSALSEEVFRPGEIFHEPVAESADMLLFEEFDPQGGDQENVQPNNWLETTTASVVNYELEQFQHIPPIQQNVPMIHQDVPCNTIACRAAAGGITIPATAGQQLPNSFPTISHNVVLALYAGNHAAPFQSFPPQFPYHNVDPAPAASTSYQTPYRAVAEMRAPVSASEVFDIIIPKIKPGEAKSKGVRKFRSVMSKGGILTTPEHIAHCQNLKEKRLKREARLSQKSQQPKKPEKPKKVTQKSTEKKNFQQGQGTMWGLCVLCVSWFHENCGRFETDDHLFICNNCEYMSENESDGHLDTSDVEY